jgi:hypothetical protein
MSAPKVEELGLRARGGGAGVGGGGWERGRGSRPAAAAGEYGRLRWGERVGGVRDRQQWLDVRAQRARPDLLSGGSHGLGGGGEVPSIEGMERSF